MLVNPFPISFVKCSLVNLSSLLFVIGAVSGWTVVAAVAVVTVAVAVAVVVVVTAVVVVVVVVVAAVVTVLASDVDGL